MKYKENVFRDFPCDQWFRLCAPNAGSMGLIPGLGTKILHARWHSQKMNKQTNKYILKNQGLSVVFGPYKLHLSGYFKKRKFL